MTDQTPAADDDRKAHEWCDSPARQSTEALAPIIRAIRAHVPAPPATLAEQILDIAGHISSDFGAYADDLNALADRVDEMEGKLRDTYNALVFHIENSAKCMADRDEARAEMERAKRVAGRESLCLANAQREHRAELARLNAEVERLTQDRLDRNPETKARVEDALAHPERSETVTVMTPTLPDPADVPEREVWEVTRVGRRAIGFRRDTGPDYHTWALVYEDGVIGRADDAVITLVARLVPDVRRVIDRPEDLDKLPAGSIVLDGDGDPWKKSVGGHWYLSPVSRSASYLLDRYGPVTVIHEPEVTA